MHRYDVQKCLGDGTYGSVHKAKNRQTNEVVAIKTMKRRYSSWEECINLREIKSLRKLSHPNIVKLREVIRENGSLHLVFEHMDCNLYQRIKDRTSFLPEAKVRNIIYQVLLSLAFLHKNGYFHRDLKPENILLRGDVCKLADFGLAREIRSRPPYTDYVSTRWYRAPEILLRSRNYSSPIDLWAVGTVFAEVLSLRPLFPGSSEADQIARVCAVIGTPTYAEWPDGLKQAASVRFKFPNFSPKPLAQIIPHASAEAIELVQALCQWNPEKRPTAAQALQFPFFEAGLKVPRNTTSSSNNKLRLVKQLMNNTYSKPQAIEKKRYNQEISSQAMTRLPKGLQPVEYDRKNAGAAAAENSKNNNNNSSVPSSIFLPRIRHARYRPGLRVPFGHGNSSLASDAVVSKPGKSALPPIKNDLTMPQSTVDPSTTLRQTAALKDLKLRRAI